MTKTQETQQTRETQETQETMASMTSMTSMTSNVKNEMPQSIEEAGALLAASINFYGTPSSTIITPPKGMHSSFSVLSPVPSSTLLVHLHSLRALLRNAPTDKPLVAAPSILALLMKLLGASSTLALAASSATTITAMGASSRAHNVLGSKVASPSSGNSTGSLGSTGSGSYGGSSGGPIIKRVEPPPMWSTPLRKLWVDCVVLCHALGDGLSGAARINLYGFVQNMIALAGTNPRSARAAGGTRIAAMEVLAGLLQVPKLSSQLSSWALDLIHLTQRALKSAGNGEPTYRIASVRAACAVAVACRQSTLKAKPVDGSEKLVLKGTLEDKAIVEVVKLLKQGTTDKFPEVRQATASLAGLLAPMLILSSNSSGSGSGSGLGMGGRQGGDGRGESSPTTSLEDVMTISFKNLDDKMPDVAAAWAEAFARCMCTGIEHCRQVNVESGGRRGVDADGSAPSGGSGAGGSGGNGSGGGANDSSTSIRITSGRKGTVLTSVCLTLPQAVKYLVGLFVKVGGQLMAPKAGGPFSSGGRAVRLGVCRTLVQLLRVQSQMGNIGESRDMSTKEAIMIVLTMVGSDMEAQLNAPGRNAAAATHDNLDATSVMLQGASRDTPTNTLFSQMPKKSHADPGIARVCTNRVIREGIAEVCTEAAQIAMLHDIVSLCKNNIAKLKGNQLQVLLIEASHLFTTLGEATASVVDDAISGLRPCIVHPDHGVRHEAAIALAAVNLIFPAQGKQLVQHSLNDIQMEHAELMALASTKKVEEAPETTPRLLRFGRRAPVKEKKKDGSLKHQYAIHGLALMVSMIIRDMPGLPGGLPADLFGDVMSVSEILVSSLFNEIMRQGNPSAACTSMRAGFAIICGGLTAGPEAIGHHFALIFDLWQKVGNPAKIDNTFTLSHELICVDAMLASIVAFLKWCTELLLSVPDALSRISILLEELLAAFFPDGRLGKAPANPIIMSRFQSAKASILESFAWLPPGSYPMTADSVFSFAAYHIRLASENGVPCSILQSLINKEDHLLDAKSLSRATRVGQVGGARDLEEDILTLTAEIAHHSDRESVLHLISHAPNDSGGVSQNGSGRHGFRDSIILGMYAYDGIEFQPPTPLHRVGTWQLPINASTCSKIRLVDAAVQAFSATFCLKGGKEQQSAVQMLETLIPQQTSQSTRGVVVPIQSSEQDKRGKPSTGGAAISNIVAVVLACLKAIPLHEATHNVPIGLGPLWMNKAKDLLVMLLPSSTHEVRRAAAEGLGLLATLGVTEDSHFLQSSVLHSLDELMQGNRTEAKGRSVSSEPISAVRSGALLTLACIQRTATTIQEKRLRKAHKRRVDTMAGSSSAAEQQQQEQQQQQQDQEQAESVPTTQMITKLLPSIACQGVRDFFGVRVYALHAFGILLTYSKRLERSPLQPEDEHLLKKSIELVEDNFAAAWAAGSADYDKGNETEKLASESSFLACLLRLMTLLVPHLHHVQAMDTAIATRFSCMVVIILECQDSHPAVVTEGMAFFEVLAKHNDLLPPPSRHVQYHENALLSCTPFVVAVMTPERCHIHSDQRYAPSKACAPSIRCSRAAVQTAQALSSQGFVLADLSDMTTVAAMFAKLEDLTASRHCAIDLIHRSLSEPRNMEYDVAASSIVERELCGVLCGSVSICGAGRDLNKSRALLLRAILLAKMMLSGVASDVSDAHLNRPPYNPDKVIDAALAKSAEDAWPLFEIVTSVRWQVKSIAVRVALVAMHKLNSRVGLGSNGTADLVTSAMYNPSVTRHKSAEECKRAEKDGNALPASYLAFHFSELLMAACSTCTATVDQAELQVLQENALHLLVAMIQNFGPIPDPDQPDNKLLEDSIPQVSSCIKHALGAWKEHQTASSNQLFLVGCDALEAFINARLSSEKATLKRMGRSVFLEHGESKTFAPSDVLPLSSNDDDDSGLDMEGKLLMKLGKLHMAGIVSENAPQIMSEFKASPSELGVHFAAIALDGVSLLVDSNLSLCGLPLQVAQGAKATTGNEPSGFFFDNAADLTDFAKSQLVNKWASCARNAVKFLASVVSNEGEVGAEEYAVCKAWICKIINVVFAGFQTTMSAIVGKKTNGSSKHKWARSIDLFDVANDCLQGISFIIEHPSILQLNDAWTTEVECLLQTMTASIMQPVLEGRKIARNLVSTSCMLMKRMAKAMPSSQSPAAGESALLVCMLMPLDYLQQRSLQLTANNICEVVAASLESVTVLFEESKGPPSLDEALLPVVVDILARRYDGKKETSVSGASAQSHSEIENAACRVLKACMTGASDIPISQKCEIATAMARSEVWPAWKLMCICGSMATPNAENVAALIAPSLDVIRDHMLCLSEHDTQLSALRAVHEVIQALEVPNPTTRFLTLALGAEILTMLRSYGTLHTCSRDPASAIAAMPMDATKKQRTEVFGHCMKVILTTLQQLSSEEIEAETVDTNEGDEESKTATVSATNEQRLMAYLSLLFETFVAIIRFNGLPNHPQPQPGKSDPTIGRTCAQALLHIARTYPGAFKACMGGAGVAEQDRAVLEFAVRGEMTGYAGGTAGKAAAPAKKKLNLKGFKK